MQPIIYDVAVTADGFIAGPGGDISKFPHEGQVLDDYRARLQSYACAIMGRATYEFGYGFGLAPGANPYPHMKTVVFSQSIELPGDDVEIVRNDGTRRVDELKRESEGPIYLCGGGQFAGWLLSLGMIDMLRVKRAPCFYGDGVRLFGDYTGGCDVTLRSSTSYEGGGLFQEFDVTR